MNKKLFFLSLFFIGISAWATDPYKVSQGGTGVSSFTTAGVLFSSGGTNKLITISTNSFGGGVTVYAATSTASFPFGANFSTGVFTGNVVIGGTSTPTVPLQVDPKVTITYTEGYETIGDYFYTTLYIPVVPFTVFGYYEDATNGYSSYSDSAGDGYLISNYDSHNVGNIDYTYGTITSYGEVIDDISYYANVVTISSEAARFNAAITVNMTSYSDGNTDGGYAIGYNRPDGTKLVRSGAASYAARLFPLTNYYGAMGDIGVAMAENFMIDGTRIGYGATYTDAARGNHPTDVMLVQYYGDNGYQSLFSLQNLGIGDAIFGGYGTYSGVWARQDGRFYASESVGIGVTSQATEKLDVNGNAKVRGSVITDTLSVSTATVSGSQGLKFTTVLSTSSAPSAINILGIGPGNVLYISTGTSAGAWVPVKTR